MTEHNSFRSLISERQHEAEAALVRGDVGPRLRMWSHNDPVALFAAVGPSMRVAGANMTGPGRGSGVDSAIGDLEQPEPVATHDVVRRGEPISRLRHLALHTLRG